MEASVQRKYQALMVVKAEEIVEIWDRFLKPILFLGIEQLKYAVCEKALSKYENKTGKVLTGSLQWILPNFIQ